MNIHPPTERAAAAMRVLAHTPALKSLADRGWLTYDIDRWHISTEHFNMLSTGEIALLELMDQLGTLALYIQPLDMDSRAFTQVALDALFAVPAVAVVDGESLISGAAAS